MKVYIAGGAGYIGTHLVSALNKLKIETVVLDDLSKHPDQVFPYLNEFHRLDLSGSGAIDQLAKIFSTSQNNDVVVHLAARKSVSESVKNPHLYEANNLGATRNLLKAIEKSKIRQIVFASSAAVYGGANEIVSEESPCNPESPYAAIKLAEENLINEYSTSIGLKYLILRFFNVIGAMSPDMSEDVGENILPVIISLALQDEPFHIFGNDYPTPDGTCIRDYISVLDVVDAIVKSITSIATFNSQILNLGTGEGVSVKEFAEIVNCHIPIEIIYDQPRDGDPAKLITDASKAQSLLKWKANIPIEEAILSAIPNSLRLK